MQNSAEIELTEGETKRPYAAPFPWVEVLNSRPQIAASSRTAYCGSKSTHHNQWYAVALSGKKISHSDIIGERGVAHVRKVVAAMGYLFYETGGVEAGIDGFIEIRDPDTGEVANQTIQFQSKATTKRLPGDSDDGFHWNCSDKDIHYWSFGTMPMILIVVDVEHDKAYWKDLRAWFAEDENRAGKKVHFDKKEDLFNADAALAIRTVSENGWPGTYYSAPRKSEYLTPNLLRVTRLPDTLYWAPTDANSVKQLWFRARELDPYPNREVILRENALLSFRNLDSHPWREICDAGAMEEFDAEEWSQSGDPDRERNFVQLLNQALQAMVGRDLRFDPKHRTLFFKPNRGPKKRRFGYRAEQKQSGRWVASPYYKKGKKNELAYWRHSAFSWQFLRIGRDWFIQITPTYHYTRDGSAPDKFAAEHLAGIKRKEWNDAVRGQFVMWREYLCSKGKTDLFGDGYPYLGFSPVNKLQANFGINDAFWKSSEGRIGDGEADLFG